MLKCAKKYINVLNNFYSPNLPFKLVAGVSLNLNLKNLLHIKLQKKRNIDCRTSKYLGKLLQAIYHNVYYIKK